MSSRLLVVMGSAETTPTMIKPHRSIFERVGDRPAVLLDTPYGFQENADDISARAIDYFAKSVGRTVGVASYRTDAVDVVTAETARTRVREAGWVFAGPGSPTYTLRVLTGSGIPELLADKLATGGAVVFSSAAALTIGVATVPVYEVYKAGADPYWAPGFNLITAAGLDAAVIPHFDNAEGGHHDTRFCYLGERRLAMIEPALPDGVFVLGVDEHTGLILDLDADAATIVGLGTVTVRRRGHSITFPAGSTIPIDDLRRAGRGETVGAPTSGALISKPVVATTADRPSPTGRTPLLDDAQRLDTVFAEALAAGDSPGALGAILELEEMLAAWRGDNAATDEPDRARAILRSMLVRLGEAATTGLRDPRALLGPVIDVALAQRAGARARKDFAASDVIRDALAAAGVEVRDTADGQQWELHER